jgi:fluoride ion exporter CrcB/FEX
MDAVKAKQLGALLGTLPVPVAARLAKAIEVDRLSGGALLPHEIILDSLRPLLRRTQASDRTPTPLRLFCRPFEDLLTLQPRKEKLKGRISRASIMPVWNWLSQTLAANAASAFSIGVKMAAMGKKPADAMTHASQFWGVAAQALHAALDGEKNRKAARGILGDDLIVADAQEMALLLSVGMNVVDVQAALPLHTPSFTEELVWNLREIYDRVVEAVPDAAPYIAVVAMNRLERPWEALKMPLHVSRQTQDTLISSTDMGMVGEILLCDIETHASFLRTAQPRQFDPDALIGHIAGFTTLSSGIVKGIEMRRDGKWGQRLMKDRAAVGEIMDSFMERAAKEIQTALPTIKSGSYAGGPRVPDISHMPDPDKTARALNYLRLVSGCRSFSAAGSFGASNKEAIDEIGAVLKRYNEDILKELRAADEKKRAIAEQFFGLATEMVEILYGVEEAEVLRRRGRAAMPAVAAA